MSHFLNTVLILVWALVLPAGVNANVVPLSLTANTWSPYIIFTNAGPQGLAPDKIRRAANYAGYRISFAETPFPRALDLAEHVKSDGMTLLRATEKRQTFMIFTQPLFCDRRFILSVMEDPLIGKMKLP